MYDSQNQPGSYNSNIPSSDQSGSQQVIKKKRKMPAAPPLGSIGGESKQEQFLPQAFKILVPETHANYNYFKKFVEPNANF